jgi:hypothetical protein
MTQELEQQHLAMLAERLALATSAGNARWEMREPEVYSWTSTKGAVSVASRDRDGEAPYEVTVCNSAGQQVDGLTSELLDGDRPAPWNEALAELHRVARRSALRADEIIDALIEELPGGDGEPGHERSFLRFTRNLASVTEERP